MWHVNFSGRRTEEVEPSFSEKRRSLDISVYVEDPFKTSGSF